MSEQRIIEVFGRERSLPGELSHQPPADASQAILEVERMMTAVRDQLAELAKGLRTTLRATEPVSLGRAETTSMGIRRIVCGQIDAAIGDLELRGREDPGDAVHACRKRFKRVRAATRLLRDELGTETYRLENAAFRDFGRGLSHARDSQVLVETLDALQEHYAPEVPAGSFLGLRSALAEEHRAVERQLREKATADPPMIIELRAARDRVASWSLGQDSAGTLEPGFERIYRAGRRAFRAALTDPTDDSFHELRKRTKDLWHAAQILRPTAPKTLKTLADNAHRLSDLVGDDHDLAVLSEQVDLRPQCFADEREKTLLEALISRRRGQIQSEALELAHRIFVPQPHLMTAALGQGGAVDGHSPARSGQRGPLLARERHSRP